MDKEFVSYEQALALKELGFRELSLACYDKCNMLSTYSRNVFEPLNYNNYNNSGHVKSAPLKQQVFRWFRERYSSQCDIWQYEDDLSFAFSVKIKFKGMDAEIGFKTYEEAENAAIDKLIEIAKQQDNGII